MAQRIFWAGDSTVKTNTFETYPQTGIGQVLGRYLKKSVIIINHAENGRSTKSFIDESRLAHIYNDLRAEDFLFIQFGHNDGKKQDPDRYTDPYGAYQVNLEKFINAARNRGAYPVLITPVCRRWFQEDGNLMEDIHGDYPEAMAEIAENLEVPLIDLFEASRKAIASWGELKSRDYFVSTDNTHLNHAGAFAFAGLIAEGLKSLGGIYSDLLLIE